MNESPKFSLNGADLWKTIRGGIITLAAVALTAMLAFVADQYQSWDYSLCVPASGGNSFCIDMRLFAIPFIGSVIELGRRFVAGLPK